MTVSPVKNVGASVSTPYSSAHATNGVVVERVRRRAADANMLADDECCAFNRVMPWFLSFLWLIVEKAVAVLTQSSRATAAGVHGRTIMVDGWMMEWRKHVSMSRCQHRRELEKSKKARENQNFKLTRVYVCIGGRFYNFTSACILMRNLMHVGGAFEASVDSIGHTVQKS
jgi:hypothetical protein